MKQYCIVVMFVWVMSESSAQTGDTLEQRVTAGDAGAILEAGAKQRVDLIPALRNAAKMGDAIHNSPRTLARQVLAKFGDEQYRREIRAELLETTKTEFYLYQIQHGEDAARAEWITKDQALKKIEYIGSEWAVASIAPLLYYNGDLVTRIPHTAHEQFDSPPYMAALALTKMNLPNAPIVDKFPIPKTKSEQEELAKWLEQHRENPFAGAEERIAAWQKWWEQNKDKYP